MTNLLPLTWSDGQSLCNETIDVSDLDKPIGLFFQNGFNTTTVTFVALDDDGNQHNVKDLTQTEVALIVTNTQSEYLPLDPAVFSGINKLKVRRGTASAPFTTGAENTRIIFARRAY